MTLDTNELREKLESWRCMDCGCRTFARCDEVQPGTAVKFAPGNCVRCVSCKRVSFYPLVAEEAPALLDRLDAAERALGEAEEALKPFAAVADAYSESEDPWFETWRDCHEPAVKAASTLNHFRRARTALSHITETRG